MSPADDFDFDFDSDRAEFYRGSVARTMVRYETRTIGDMLRKLNPGLFDTLNGFAAGDSDDAIKIRGFMRISASDLQIKPQTVGDTVESMEAVILEEIADGEIHSKASLLDLFDEVNFATDAQARANFEEAMNRIYAIPGVERLTSGGKPYTRGRVYGIRKTK